MKIKFKIAVLASAAAMLLPSAVFAARVGASVSVTATASSSPSTTDKNFCTNLPSLTSQVNSKISTGQSGISGRQQNRQTQLADRQNKRATELANTRAKGDADRQAAYAQLTAKATTDAQKQEIIQFRTTMEAAVTTRRAAVD